MRPTLLITFALVLASGVAAAKQVKYAGHHPIGDGDDFCYLEVPHVHVYAPPAEAEVVYRPHGDDGLVFVGDPAAHGYDGPTVAYFGPHPIQIDVVLGPGGQPETCYLEGPHSHAYAPPPGARFVARENVYYFSGDLPVVAVEARPRFVEVNRYYKHHGKRWKRPVVVGPPPVEYRVPAFVVEGAVVAPVGVVGADLHGPGIRAGVEINIPLPTIEVRAPVLVVEPRTTVVVPGVVHTGKPHNFGKPGKRKGH